MDVQEIAREAFAVLGTGRQVAPFSARWPDFRLEDAYRVAAAVRTQRETRGERPVGRKIGFTNRTIWAEYNVHAPMWGYLYDRTVRDLPKGSMGASLRGLAEPRIEPEIVFGLAAAPTPGMNERALLGCIDWVAHGFEIVQSIFPNWTFLAADTIAAYGLHGALWIGPRHSVASRSADWRRELSGFEIDLFRNGVLVDHGRAANVLDGPIFALASRGIACCRPAQSAACHRGDCHDWNAHARLSGCERRRMDHGTDRHSARRRAHSVRLSRVLIR